MVYDGVQAAIARKADVLFVDTAGRLHNKTNLMKELDKIYRVIRKEIPDGPHETLLVLDATTGQNGLIQAKQFREAAGITGIVLTKLGRHRQGGHRHRHRPGAGRACEVRRGRRGDRRPQYPLTTLEFAQALI